MYNFTFTAPYKTYSFNIRFNRYANYYFNNGVLATNGFFYIAQSNNECINYFNGDITFPGSMTNVELQSFRNFNGNIGIGIYCNNINLGYLNNWNGKLIMDNCKYIDNICMYHITSFNQEINLSAMNLLTNLHLIYLTSLNTPIKFPTTVSNPICIDLQSCSNYNCVIDLRSLGINISDVFLNGLNNFNNSIYLPNEYLFNECKIKSNKFFELGPSGKIYAKETSFIFVSDSGFNNAFNNNQFILNKDPELNTAGLYYYENNVQYMSLYNMAKKSLFYFNRVVGDNFLLSGYSGYNNMKFIYPNSLKKLPITYLTNFTGLSFYEVILPNQCEDISYGFVNTGSNYSRNGLIIPNSVIRADYAFYSSYIGYYNKNYSIEIPDSVLFMNRCFLNMHFNPSSPMNIYIHSNPRFALYFMYNCNCFNVYFTNQNFNFHENIYYGGGSNSKGLKYFHVRSSLDILNSKYRTIFNGNNNYGLTLTNINEHCFYCNKYNFYIINDL